MSILLSKAAPALIPRRPSQGNFNAMMKARQRELDELNKRPCAREITVREWADEFDRVLLNGHTRAWMLGRQRAGDLAELNNSDFLAGMAAKDPEAYYLHGFMQDIVNGRYLDDQGNLNYGPIRSRSQLYVGRMRGTASESWAVNSPQDMRVYWIMLALEHCEDCPRMAALTANSEFTSSELWAFPGDGSTRCVGNCKCVLRLEDGAESFRHPSTPADAPDIPVQAVQAA